MDGIADATAVPARLALCPTAFYARHGSDRRSRMPALVCRRPIFLVRCTSGGRTRRRGAGEGVEHAARVDVEGDADGGRRARPQPEHPAGRAGEAPRGRMPVR